MKFTGERIVPNTKEVEPTFQKKMLQEHYTRYLFASQFIKNKQVLDLGCGAGYGSDLMLKHGNPKNIKSIDISSEAIEFAKKHYETKELNYYISDATKTAFESNSFDVIVCYELIEHLKEPENLIKEISRIIKKDGLLIISTPRKKNSNRSNFHVHEFKFEEFKLLLKKYFKESDFLVENNIFASIINKTGNIKGKIDDSINFDIPGVDNGDYFIAVCSNTTLPKLPTNIATFNNDEYILNMEKDIDILRNAENFHLSKINELSESIIKSEKQNKYLQTEISQHQQVINQITNTKGWKIIKKLYSFKELFTGKPENPSYNLKSRLKHFTVKIIEIYKQNGIKGLKKGFKKFLIKKIPLFSNQYQLMIKQQEEKFFDNLPDPILKINPKKFSILIISGCENTAAETHRVFHFKEVLDIAGIKNKIIPHSQLDSYLLYNSDEIFTYDLFYVHRAGWDKSLEKLFKAAKILNHPIIYDIDDLVFDEEAIPKISIISSWSDEKKFLYRESVIKYWKAMSWADFLTSPTNYLKEKEEKIFKHLSFTLRNHLDIKSFKTTEKFKNYALSRKRKTIKIGYMSGTATHNQDFIVASEAILKLLKEYPHLKLEIIGPLELPSSFNDVKNQIEKIKFVPFHKLFEIMSDFDINIAPLEIDNEYCESKSELKYFFAGVLNIPTVASPTDAFKWAIKDGQTGFLANSEKEWYQKLKQLIINEKLRKNIGKNANKNCDYYKPEFQSKITRQTFKEIIENWNKQKTLIGIKEKNKLTINFVLPEPLNASGGHAVVFRMSEKLSSWGHHVNIYFVTVDGNHPLKDNDDLEKFTRINNLQNAAHFHLGLEKIEPSDALIATYWKTAYMIEKINNTKKKFYLTMDYEPFFYPVNSAYVMAENSYKLGYYHIATGHWIPKVIKQNFGAEGEGTDIATDKSIYYPRAIEREPNSICFFAKPHMPRRGFEIGIEALKILKDKSPDTKIYFYGEKDFSDCNISFEYINCGIMPEDKLAELYCKMTASLSFSLSNPSVIGLQAMHCGCPVIELDYPTNDGTYINNVNCLLAPPYPEGVTQTIIKVLNSKKLQNELHQKGLEWAKKISYDNSATKFLSILKREINKNNEKKKDENHLSSSISLPNGWY